MISILILEDNDDKVMKILTTYKDMVKNNPVFIARSSAQAVGFILASPGEFYLFLDQELMPGNGSGTQLLEWILAKPNCGLIGVVATSFSLSACKFWRELCEKAGIPIERAW